MTLEARYRRYTQQCAEWDVPAQPFEDWKAYWEFFAQDGEMPA